MKPVAICLNLLSRKRTSFSKIDGFERCLDKLGIPWEYLDCYRYDIVAQLPRYSALIWHYSNFVNADLMEAQNLLNLAESLGLVVFPDYHSGWHFDDKIAEMYALQAVNAPIPASWVFYELDACEAWLDSDAKYPLVAKLRRGSGSNNVKLLRSPAEAKRYARRMFNGGFSPTPSLIYKTYSKIQSTRNRKMLLNRIKQIPNFLAARKFGKGMPKESGYCYFQEYIPNEGYDLKVVVIGNKMTFCARNVRKGDFRASGGGDCYYDRNLLTNSIIDSAYAVAENLKMDCVGFDYVVDHATGAGKIVEMCFGFDYDVQYELGAYVDKSHVWHENPVNVAKEIIDMIVLKVNTTNEDSISR